MSDLKEQLEQCEADAEEFCAEISSLNGTISKLRQALRDLLLCIQVPADAPAYAAAVKLLHETEAKL